jgi:hypothetical protein
VAREVVGETTRGRDSRLTERLGPLEAIERYLEVNPELLPRRETLMAAARDLLREMTEEPGPPR